MKPQSGAFLLTLSILFLSWNYPIESVNVPNASKNKQNMKLDPKKIQNKHHKAAPLQELINNHIVCEKNGLFLGLLNTGQTCNYVYTRCMIMVKKQKNLHFSILQEILKAKAKGKAFEPHMKQEANSPQDKHKSLKKADIAAKEIKMQLDIKQHKKMSEKEKSQITQLIVEKANKLAKSGNKQSQKMPTFQKVQKGNDKGHYCVQAIHYNLNYCCHFNNKADARFFANSLPYSETD